MKSLADALPPEIAQQIHPDWRKNEADYWTVRDKLLSQYQGQWIAFADGAVIVAASTPLDVFLAVHESGHHPFVIRVGHEDEPWYHIRRTSFAYDTAYPPTALPVLSAEFRSTSGAAGSRLDRVIPDTGATERIFIRDLFGIRWQLDGRGLLSEKAIDESLTKTPA